jgi:hypothetical protein
MMHFGSTVLSVKYLEDIEMGLATWRLLEVVGTLDPVASTTNKEP